MDKNTVEKMLKKLYDLRHGFIDNNNVKRLTDYTPEYRLRVGDYRILFDVRKNIIYIQEVRTRQKGY